MDIKSDISLRCQHDKGGRLSMRKDFYKEKIILMLESINDEKFLNQIRTLLKLHIEKKGEAA